MINFHGKLYHCLEETFLMEPAFNVSVGIDQVQYCIYFVIELEFESLVCTMIPSYHFS